MEEKNALRSRIVGLRFTIEEFKKIEKGWKASTCRKLSDYLRRIVFGKPVKVLHRNGSLDDFMTELIKLREELNRVGNNFNQAVKKLNTLKQYQEFHIWIITYELDRKNLNRQIENISNRFNAMAETWLQ